MNRRCPFASVWVLAALFCLGCGKEPKPNLAINQPLDPAPAASSSKGQTPQQQYEAALARAIHHLAENRRELALAAFLEAQAAINDEFVKSEIERLKHQIDRALAGDRIAADIQSVINAGQANEAAQLATIALGEFGDTDAAERLIPLKRQADALIATQAKDSADRQKYLADAEIARQGNNLRAALCSYDVAVGIGVDVSPLRATYETLRVHLLRYDELRRQAAELRRDAARVDEALAVLEQANSFWPTLQLAAEMDDLRLAIAHRRERLAVADFEVLDDVGIPLAGRLVAEELLPHFRPRYDLVERTQITAVLADLKLDPRELHASERGRAEVARLAKARYVVVGDISRLNAIVVHARLVDAASGLVLQTAKLTAATSEELTSKLPELAKILQMTDEEKIAYDQQLAQTAVVSPADVGGPLPPAAGLAETTPPVRIWATARPPECGPIVAADFVFPAPDAHPQVLVIGDSPWRKRALIVAVDNGDCLLRSGFYSEAVCHYQFALSLSPENLDIRQRIDLCLPYLATPAAAARPRLAVMPFAEIGQTGSAPYGMGAWLGERLSPYFYPGYDLVDHHEMYWWMGRLGLTLHDLLADPSARLLLARALGVRYLLVGNLQQGDDLEVSTQLVDAEFNSLVGSGRIRVHSRQELRYRLPELARLTLMAASEQAAYVEQAAAARPHLDSARLEFQRGRFKIAIGFYRDALAAHPECIEAQFALADAQRRQHQAEIAEARRAAFEQQQAARAAEQQRQQQLATAVRQQATTVVAVAVDTENRREQASVQLVMQARQFALAGKFAVSISFFEGAAAFDRSGQLVSELAAARAQAAAAEHQRQAQAEADRRSALKQQYQQQIQVAAAAVTADSQRRALVQQSRRFTEQANDNAAYDQLIEQAAQARAKRQYDVALSALQTARTLQPSVKIEQMVSAALDDQARAHAEQLSEAERQKWEQQAAATRERQQQALVLAQRKQAEHDAAIKLAFAAMNAKDYAQGKVQFEAAFQAKRSKEAQDGIRWANDEMAKAKLLADRTRKIQENLEKQKADYERLLTEARQSAAARQFGPATEKLQAAIRLQPASVEAQIELVRVRQAQAAPARQATNVAGVKASNQVVSVKAEGPVKTNKPTPPPVPEVRQPAEDKVPIAYVQAMRNGQAEFQRSNYAAAVTHFNEALKLKPKDQLANQWIDAAKQRLAIAAKAPAEAERLQNYQAAMAKAQTAAQAQQHEAAAEAYNTALKQVPNDAAAAHGLRSAREAIAAGETRPASESGVAKKDAPSPVPVAVKKDATTIVPASAQGQPKGDPAAQFKQRVQTAVDYEGQGKYSDAHAQFEEALKLAPNHAELKKKIEFCRLMADGSAELQAGKSTEAANQFTAALKIYPNDVNAKRFLQAATAQNK